MNTNLQNIFDAITGHDGAAAVDGWRDMSRAELIEHAEAQASEYYESITADEAARIANAVIARRDCDNSNDIHNARATLAD